MKGRIWRFCFVGWRHNSRDYVIEIGEQLESDDVDEGSFRGHGHVLPSFSPLGILSSFWQTKLLVVTLPLPLSITQRCIYKLYTRSIHDKSGEKRKSNIYRHCLKNHFSWMKFFYHSLPRCTYVRRKKRRGLKRGGGR